MNERVNEQKPVVERDYLADLGAAVAAYISTLQTIAACVSESSADVGKPYGTRIQKLQARLAFNPTRDAIRESAEVVRGELMNFATLSAMQFERHALEFERSSGAVQHLLHGMVRRQEFFLSRLRQTAEELNSAPYPANADEWKHFTSQHSASLAQLADSISHEAASQVHAIREELESAVDRLGDFHTCDPVTGLMTREEVLRRIEALQAEEITHTLLVYTLSGDVTDTVLRQIAAKLAAHFRHQDLIARWNEREFIVVFHGEPHLAETRSLQVIPSINGRYQREDGEAADVQAVVKLEQMATATL
jgi:GGDEF domain-containing protein